jgi:hypothetical protein
MASLRGEAPAFQAFSRLEKLTCIGCYSLAGGIGGILLASPGLESVAEAILPNPIPQAMFLVAIHALVLSFLPLLALLSLLRFPKASPGTFLFLEFAPALLCALVALLVLLVSPLPTGRVWLGGLLPDVTLNLLMFISARLVLKGYPGTIRLSFTNFGD